MKHIGLIPARAGNTNPRCAVPPGCGAHPRSRGEHQGERGLRFFREGSSPLARGTLASGNEVTNALGLIPARAGNTAQSRKHYEAYRAHPRSRGEHAAKQGGVDGGLGSSPLARGTPELTDRGGLTTGLIPARAGNTFRLVRKLSRARAHPRSRGEHPARDCE